MLPQEYCIFGFEELENEEKISETRAFVLNVRTTDGVLIFKRDENQNFFHCNISNQALI